MEAAGLPWARDGCAGVHPIKTQPSMPGKHGQHLILVGASCS